MKKINYILIVFLLSSCSNIDFILSEKSSKTPINNLTIYEIDSSNPEYISGSLIKNFGSLSYEESARFLLRVSAAENIVKTSIDTNQVTSSVQYNIEIVYNLSVLNSHCKNLVKKYEIKFTHYPKSEGYNFGADRALVEVYKNNINKNIVQFKKFIETDSNLTECLNES